MVRLSPGCFPSSAGMIGARRAATQRLHLRGRLSPREVVPYGRRGPGCHSGRWPRRCRPTCRPERPGHRLVPVRRVERGGCPARPGRGAHPPAGVEGVVPSVPAAAWRTPPAARLGRSGTGVSTGSARNRPRPQPRPAGPRGAGRPARKGRASFEPRPRADRTPGRQEDAMGAACAGRPVSRYDSTEDHFVIRRMARGFAVRRIVPRAAACGRQERVPAGVVRQGVASGMCGTHACEDVGDWDLRPEPEMRRGRLWR